MQPGYPPQGYQYPQPGQMPAQSQFPPTYPPNPSAPQNTPQSAPAAQFQAPAPQSAAELGFSDPSGGVANPTARHLDGRTIVIVPKRVDEQAKYQGQDRPTAYFDMYVVDGGPIMYGDSEDRANPRPFTHTIETPAYFADAMSGNVLFVNEVRSKLDASGRPTGMALGVVQRGTRGNKPWLLTRCEKDVDGNERQGGDARRDAAQRLVFAHRSGEWTPPRATPLAQAQAPAVPQVQYSQAPQQYGAQLPPTPNPYAAVPAAAPMQPYAPVPQGVNVNAPTSAVPSPPTGYAPAPGWEGNPAWMQFTPDQQSQIWAQSQQAGAPSTVPAAGQAATPQPAPPAGNGPGW